MEDELQAWVKIIAVVAIVAFFTYQGLHALY